MKEALEKGKVSKRILKDQVKQLFRLVGISKSDSLKINKAKLNKYLNVLKKAINN